MPASGRLFPGSRAQLDAAANRPGAAQRRRYRLRTPCHGPASAWPAMAIPSINRTFGLLTVLADASWTSTAQTLDFVIHRPSVPVSAAARLLLAVEEEGGWGGDIGVLPRECRGECQV